LAAQTLKDFEVVLIDNGSTDGSLDGIESHWPGLPLRVERLGENRGFAVANNLGARLAYGQWLAAAIPARLPHSQDQADHAILQITHYD
jgi:GT2 family glycosyltransferase